jgi:putative FmdB family regulatory protein
MPLYDYRCQTCGPFREWRRMQQYEQSVPCPLCSLPAPRLPTSPMVPVLSANERIAHARNEKSAHEPAVVRREDLVQHDTHREHHHSPHRGHHHGTSPLIRKQFGEVQRSPRRWMIGH